MLSVLAALLMQGAAPQVGDITQPTWLTKPSAGEFTALYPAEALRKGLEGSATIRCHVGAGGGLTGCLVTQQDPPDAGFGDAAVHMADLFHMAPRERDGTQTTGREISMPIRFKLPEPLVAGPALKLKPVATPGWLRMPVGEDLARVYPDHASATDLEGMATMRCIVAAKGNLTDCTVVSEDPKGEGFGSAALKVAFAFRAAPATNDGVSVLGSPVTIPILFRLPDQIALKDIVLTEPTFTDGSAVVDCRAQARGIDNCFMVSEEPKGSGSGLLAMQLAPHLPLKVGDSSRFTVRMVFKKGPAPRAH